MSKRLGGIIGWLNHPKIRFHVNVCTSIVLYEGLDLQGSDQIFLLENPNWISVRLSE